KVLVIEELHSLPKSAKKDTLIKQLKEAHLSDAAPDIILWEKRSLTATMLKPFAKATVEEFKLSPVLFKWLDKLGTEHTISQLLKVTHEVYAQDGAEFAFVMLIRQVRLLLAAKDDGQLKGAPFVVQKIKAQARAFSIEKLKELHG